VGFVIAALNAASAASREVVALRVLSAGILSPRAGLHFFKNKLGTVMMRWSTLGDPSEPSDSLPIRCKLKADVGVSSIARRTSVRCALSRGKGAVASRGLRFQASRTREPKANPYEVSVSSKGTSSRCPSGSSFVLDCANDRREYGAASASGDHL
jgi:hypothetical protein